MEHGLTPEPTRTIHEMVKNWGRWGDDDERGALNRITPEKRREGAAHILCSFNPGLAEGCI